MRKLVVIFSLVLAIGPMVSISNADPCTGSSGCVTPCPGDGCVMPDPCTGGNCVVVNDSCQTNNCP